MKPATGVRRPQMAAVAVFIWVAAMVLALGASIGTLALLNHTLYSAAAFVERYFDEVAHDNVNEILATPGVAITSDEYAALGIPSTTSSALLRNGITSDGPEQVQVTADHTMPGGTHEIEVSYQLDGQNQQASFQIAPRAKLLGVIQRWEFVQSPLQLLTVQLQHGTHFSVGSLTLDARAASTDDPSAFNHTANYLALAPASYQLSYSSKLITASPVVANVLPGQRTTATVNVQPTQALVDKVQSNLKDFLTQCATQQVLQPSGCPFGASIDDRVTSDPQWSILTDPTVTLTAQDTGFVMPSTPGTARLSVDVQSLYDGSTSTLDKTVDYSVALTVILRDDGSIAIQLH